MSVSTQAVRQSGVLQRQEPSGEADRTAGVKRVAIIGGGVSGLICARECLRERHRVSIFEKKKEIGGTWNFESISTELQIKNVFDEDWPSLTRSVHSSLFCNVRVNNPREVMGFTDFPFDDKFEGSADKRRYCSHEEVNRYIKAFVRYFDLEQFIQFESEVVNIDVSDKNNVKWNVEVNSAGNTTVHEFDAVVVSNGQYTVPNIPDIKNIDKFECPCVHSHLYRNADPFKGMTVVVYGGSYSGRDVALEIGKIGKEVYVCSRTHLKGTDTSKPLGKRQNVHLLPDIAECTGKGELKLKDGRVLENIDVMIFCTGYRYEFPFFEKSGIVQTDQGFVYPVYRHIFHPLYPTLAFTTLPDRILASMIAEFQSKYIARVFSGRCALPDTKTMIDVIDRSVEQHKKERGTLETYHHLPLTQFDYIRSLAEDCGDVTPLPDWREQMYALAGQVLTQFPENFRDRQMNDPVFDQAREEIVALRASMNSHT